MIHPSYLHWPLQVTVEPIADGDSEDMESLIGELSADYAEFLAIRDRDSASVLIGACDEDALVKNLALLRSKSRCDFNVGAPQVGYCETIGKAVDVNYIHRKQTGGTCEFARVRIAIEPLEGDYGVEFENQAAGDAVPERYLPGVERGIQGLIDRGVVAGFPMIGFKVSLLDGSYHDADSSEMAFEQAAYRTFQLAILEADPFLLEPVLRVDVLTPKDCLAALVEDLNSRRGWITSTEPRGADVAVAAFVPAAHMFVYANNLDAIAEGRASCTVRFDRYEKVPSTPSDEPPARRG